MHIKRKNVKKFHKFYQEIPRKWIGFFSSPQMFDLLLPFKAVDLINTWK